MKSPDGWESLFWGVFQRSANPILVLDEHERVLAVNDAALELVGRTRLEMLGSPVANLFDPPTRPAAARDWQKMLRAGDYTGTRRIRLKDGSVGEVDYASRSISVPGRVLVLAVVQPATAPSFSRSPGAAPTAPLTKREREVVQLIALGMETPAIAKKLFITENTVRTHVRNAMEHLGARTRAHLVAITLSDQAAEAAPGDRGRPGRATTRTR